VQFLEAGGVEVDFGGIDVHRETAVHAGGALHTLAVEFMQNLEWIAALGLEFYPLLDGDDGLAGEAEDVASFLLDARVDLSGLQAFRQIFKFAVERL